jgi:SAM-dependent methyltransferase
MDSALYELFYALEDTHWWFQGRKEIVLDLLRRYSPVPAPRILDVGCGTGGMSAAYATAGPSVGVDTAPEAAEFCTRRGLPMLLASGAELPIRDRSFDVVSALDVIEHIDDEEGVLREMFRVCRPGGLLLLTVPAFNFLWSKHDDLNHHKRRYIRSQLAACVKKAGFEPLVLSYYNALLLPAAVLRKFVLRFDNNGTACHLERVPAPVNGLFRRILTMERPLLAHVELPVGASLICVARRPACAPASEADSRC